MPSRATLARRLHKKSTDSIDRAMKELVAIGAVTVEHRYDGGQRLTNAYHLRTSRPAQHDPVPLPDGGGRKSAATRTGPARGGRTDAARVAADSGHDPEHLTQSTTTSPTPARSTARRPSVAEEEAAGACGIEHWSAFVAEIQQMRGQLGAPVTRWAGPSLASALQLAVRGRGWPAEHAAQALRRVAANPKTIGPMRLAEASPWWDEKPKAEPDEDLRAMEEALLESGGVRIQLQLQARKALEAAGLPVTRAAVTRSAFELLTRRLDDDGAA